MAATIEADIKKAGEHFLLFDPTLTRTVTDQQTHTQTSWRRFTFRADSFSAIDLVAISTQDLTTGLPAYTPLTSESCRNAQPNNNQEIRIEDFASWVRQKGLPAVLRRYYGRYTQSLNSLHPGELASLSDYQFNLSINNQIFFGQPDQNCLATGVFVIKRFSGPIGRKLLHLPKEDPTLYQIQAIGLT